jgi:hypothetical protein
MINKLKRAYWRFQLYYTLNFWKRTLRIYPWSDYHWRMMEKYQKQGNEVMAARHWRSHKS